MVSIEAESVQQDADCKKAMGREFKGTGDHAALTLHRAGKLINGLLTEAWNSRTKQVANLQPTMVLGRTSRSLHSLSQVQTHVTPRDSPQILLEWLRPLRAGLRTRLDLDETPVDKPRSSLPPLDP